MYNKTFSSANREKALWDPPMRPQDKDTLADTNDLLSSLLGPPVWKASLTANCSTTRSTNSAKSTPAVARGPPSRKSSKRSLTGQKGHPRTVGPCRQVLEVSSKFSAKFSTSSTCPLPTVVGALLNTLYKWVGKMATGTEPQAPDARKAGLPHRRVLLHGRPQTDPRRRQPAVPRRPIPRDPAAPLGRATTP